jgi:hypothetical protein
MFMMVTEENRGPQKAMAIMTPGRGEEGGGRRGEKEGGERRGGGGRREGR